MLLGEPLQPAKFSTGCTQRKPADFACAQSDFRHCPRLPGVLENLAAFDRGDGPVQTEGHVFAEEFHAAVGHAEV